MKKAQMSREERRIISHITKIIQHSEILRANIVHMARVCGNKNCKCSRGEKHVSMYVSRSKNGKQRLMYIPKRLENKTQRQVERYQQLKSVLDTLLEINWERLASEKS